MFKVVDVKLLEYPQGKAQIHVISNETTTWLRLINSNDMKPVCHWSTDKNADESESRRLIEALELIEKFDPFQGVEGNTRNSIPGWNTWTFGTPGPLLDFLDSSEYTYQVEALRKAK